VDFGGYPVDLSDHPPFRRAALAAARKIPYGEVRSYRWLAEAAGNPRASRAAGQAMHYNPAPLVIPCHRVVGASGALTGFGGGLAMKRALLTLEAAPLEEGK
jgi:methylated-DNA-[protein]-cysteine S-methyltransferase